MPPWKSINSPSPPPSSSELASTFSIRAPPSTDLWESPPSTSKFNTPIIYQSMPLASFKRARITLHTNLPNEAYAQCGLVMVLHYPNGGSKWIKTGLEIMHGQQMIGTVAKDRWPDWSPGTVITEEEQGSEVTIEMVREGQNLTIVEVGGGEGAKDKIIREISWAFAGDGTEEAWIGAYVAKPGSDGGDLVVDFKGFVIEQMEEEALNS